MNKDKLVEKIKEVKNNYGDGVFEEADRFYSLLSDIAPELFEERKVIKRAKDENVLYQVFELRKVKDSKVEDEIIKLKNLLKTTYGFSDKWIDLLVYSFAEAFNMVSNNNYPSCEENSFNIENKKIVNGYGEIDIGNSKKFETYCLHTLNDKYRAMYIGSGYTMIGKGAFSNRDDIEIVMIGSGVSHIKKGAFKKCKNLKYIVGAHDLISIASDAFSECVNLCAIYIDQGDFMSFAKILEKTEMHLDDKAFANCSNLQVIACKGNHDVDSVKKFCSSKKIQFKDFDEMQQDSIIRKELLFAFVEQIKIERIIEDKMR